MSNGSVHSTARDVPALHHSQKASEATANGHEINGFAMKKHVVPVDWEVPRKSLHSSIGEQVVSWSCDTAWVYSF